MNRGNTTETITHGGNDATNSPKRMLVVAPFYYPNIGGVEHYARTLVAGMMKSGEYQVTVITTNHNGKGYQKDTVDGVTVHRLPVWFRISNTPVNPLWYFWFRRIIKQISPDIIHAHSPVPFFADLASFASGSIPFVLTYHAGSMAKGKAFVDLIITLYEQTFLQLLFRRADAIVAVSQEFARTSLTKFNKKTSVIHPSVDVKKFTPTSLPEQSARIVTYVGRIEHNSAWKGVGTLLPAFAELSKKQPHATLELIGGGDAISYYQSQAEELGIEDRVKFLGPQSGPDLVAAYQRSSVVVLPSTSSSESFGIVLIEAMASQRPVIGSNIGGIPQVITDEETGLLVKPGDPHELAHALERILTDEALVNTLSGNGLKKVYQDFTEEKLLQKYQELFHDVLRSQTLIVHIAAYYPPHLGGLERVAKMCGEGLAMNNYQVKVITTTQSGREPGKIVEGYLTTVTLRSVEIAHVAIAPGFIWEMLTLPKRSLLHLHLSHAFFPEIMLLIAKLRRIPYVVHFHLDVAPSGFFGPIFVVYKRMVWGPLLRHASEIVACAKDQIAIMGDKFHIPKEKITVIPNAVSEDFFTDRVYEPSRDVLQLLYVGRLAAQKRVERLVEAMSKVTVPALLTIVGDGEDRSMLEALTKKYNLANVRFVGKKNDKEMQYYHSTSDVFVISSDKEGMPLVVLEAMAGRLPIVATKVEGLTELVEGTGELVDVPYPENFARVIDELWKTPERLKTLSQKSHDKASRYGWGEFIKRLIKVYSPYL